MATKDPGTTKGRVAIFKRGGQLQQQRGRKPGMSGSAPPKGRGLVPSATRRAKRKG